MKPHKKICKTVFFFFFCVSMLKFKFFYILNFFFNLNFLITPKKYSWRLQLFLYNILLFLQYGQWQQLIRLLHRLTKIQSLSMSFSSTATFKTHELVIKIVLPLVVSYLPNCKISSFVFCFDARIMLPKKKKLQTWKDQTCYVHSLGLKKS